MNPLLKQLTAFSITSTDYQSTSRGRENLRHFCARPSAIGETFADVSVMPSLPLNSVYPGLSYRCFKQLNKHSYLHGNRIEGMDSATGIPFLQMTFWNFLSNAKELLNP